MPGSSYSIGSSTVMMLLLPASRRLSAAYRVVVLPRTGRPGDQDDAVRLRDEVLEAPQRLAGHPDGLQAQLGFALVQQAQHGALAMRARQRAHAHVHGAGADAQADAAVLRHALFGDVEFRHDLQARDQRRVQRPVGLHHFAQGAVDAEAHARMALVRLDVDVAGAVARRLRQQRVQHADDRGVVAGLQQVLDRRQFLHHARQVGVVLHLAHDGGGARLALRIGRADALRQRRTGRAAAASARRTCASPR